MCWREPAFNRTRSSGHDRTGPSCPRPRTAAGAAPGRGGKLSAPPALPTALEPPFAKPSGASGFKLAEPEALRRILLVPVCPEVPQRTWWEKRGGCPAPLPAWSLPQGLPPLVLKSDESRSCARCCFARGSWVTSGRSYPWSCLWAQGSERLRSPAALPRPPLPPRDPQQPRAHRAILSPPTVQGLVWGSHRGISPCFWSRGDPAELRLLASAERGAVNVFVAVLGGFVPAAPQLGGAPGLRRGFPTRRVPAAGQRGWSQCLARPAVLLSWRLRGRISRLAHLTSSF